MMWVETSNVGAIRSDIIVGVYTQPKTDWSDAPSGLPWYVIARTNVPGMFNGRVPILEECPDQAAAEAARLVWQDRLSGVQRWVTGAELDPAPVTADEAERWRR